MGKRRVVTPAAARPRYTLAELLATFDPKRHGGEVMEFVPVGREILDDAPITFACESRPIGELGSSP